MHKYQKFKLALKKRCKTINVTLRSLYIHMCCSHGYLAMNYLYSFYLQFLYGFISPAFFLASFLKSPIVERMCLWKTTSIFHMKLIWQYILQYWNFDVYCEIVQIFVKWAFGLIIWLINILNFRNEEHFDNTILISSSPNIWIKM